MNLKEYQTKREQLMNEAAELLEKGNLNDSSLKMREVDDLDKEWEEYATARANLEAMNGVARAQRELLIGMGTSKIAMEGPWNNRKAKEKNCMLQKNEKFSDHMENRNQENAVDQDGALGAVVRGIVTGKWEGPELRNAVTTTSAGTLIPEVISSKVIDKARDVSLFTNAGVPIVKMDTNNVTISRVKSDPIFSFKEEGKAGKEAEFELDGVTLNSKTCYGYAYVTLEAIRSSTNLDAVLYRVFANAIAQAIDKGMLYGQYNSDTSEYDAFAPSGVMNDKEINTVEASLNGGYDDFIKAVGKIKASNGVAKTVGINSQTEELLSLLKTTEGQYLAPPKAFENAEKIVSNQLKYDAELGSDALVFDPQAMIIGMQNNIQIKIIEDGECMKKGLVGFQIYSMIDCKVVTPKHICKISGIGADKSKVTDQANK